MTLACCLSPDVLVTELLRWRCWKRNNVAFWFSVLWWWRRRPFFSARCWPSIVPPRSPTSTCVEAPSDSSRLLLSHRLHWTNRFAISSSPSQIPAPDVTTWFRSKPSDASYRGSAGVWRWCFSQSWEDMRTFFIGVAFPHTLTDGSLVCVANCSAVTQAGCASVVS